MLWWVINFLMEEESAMEKRSLIILLLFVFLLSFNLGCSRSEKEKKEEIKKETTEGFVIWGEQ